MRLTFLSFFVGLPTNFRNYSLNLTLCLNTLISLVYEKHYALREYNVYRSLGSRTTSCKTPLLYFQKYDAENVISMYEHVLKFSQYRGTHNTLAVKQPFFDRDKFEIVRHVSFYLKIQTVAAANKNVLDITLVL